MGHRDKMGHCNNYYFLLILFSPQLASTILDCISHCSFDAVIFALTFFSSLPSEEERNVLTKICIFSMSRSTFAQFQVMSNETTDI